MKSNETSNKFVENGNKPAHARVEILLDENTPVFRERISLLSVGGKFVRAQPH